MDKSEVYLEIEVSFKDGNKDWFSPIENIEEDVIINDDELSINNGYYTYKLNIKDLEKVDITKILDHEEIERENLYDFSGVK